MKIFRPPLFTFHYASTYTNLQLHLLSYYIRYLHSTMLLLIRFPICRSTLQSLQFTFHYASTYTSSWCLLPFSSCKFTFHYASTYTNSPDLYMSCAPVFTFHYASTYTNPGISFPIFLSDLHSTMLLLIPDLVRQDLVFHAHLHSTMLLLIRHCRKLFGCRKFQFTFHYASTYTQRIFVSFPALSLFTFHYASTYTHPHNIRRLPYFEFTFHYASTYTRQRLKRL